MDIYTLKISVKQANSGRPGLKKLFGGLKILAEARPPAFRKLQ